MVIRLRIVCNSCKLSLGMVIYLCAFPSLNECLRVWMFSVVGLGYLLLFLVSNCFCQANVIFVEQTLEH